jgi:two-component system sensor histidine kinase HydH
MSSTRRWDLWGALGGTVLGVCDTALLMARGVSFTLEGQDATLLVGAAFTSSFALLGFAIGALVRARARARRDADTIRRQLDQLGESQRALLQQEKLAAIGRLAAGVAHEVRNPLGVIRASASMVRESFEPEEEPYRACDFILEEIDRLNGMITSLLTFSRPTELRLQTVSIEKTLDRALHLASEQLRERGIEAERAAEGTIPELRADPDLLAQVLTGLVINAAEAMPDGGRLQVRTNVDDGHACIDVADSGPGVPVEDASRVFEPFYTTKASGTGLGLAMAARIASAHDGDLALVEGAGAGLEGAGACFRLSLPLDGPYTGPESSG